MKSLVLYLADLALDEEDYARALSLARACLPIFISFPDPDGTCHLLETIALAVAHLGLPEDSLRLYAAALATRKRRGTLHGVPAYLARYEKLLAPGRAQVDQTRRARLEAEGERLSLEEAVAHALALPEFGT